MQICADSADELFEKTLKELCCNKVEDNRMACELINANLQLNDPTKNTMCNCIRKMPMKYAIGELLWYNSCNTEWKAIYPYSKFWKGISDDGIHVNSNYGFCIRRKYDFDQWEMAKELLRNNPNSRQAVIHIKEARDLIVHPTKDVNCTIALQFILRNNKLNLIVTMRSNDIWLGLPYDLFNFTCMQIQMAMELGVDIGHYYHNAASLHLYKDDLERVLHVNNN